MGFFDDPIEERVTHYLIREMKAGRKLFDVLEDPYVQNRFPAERRQPLLEDPELLAAFEAELEKLKEDVSL